MFLKQTVAPEAKLRDQLGLFSNFQGVNIRPIVLVYSLYIKTIKNRRNLVVNYNIVTVSSCDEFKTIRIGENSVANFKGWRGRCFQFEILLLFRSIQCVCWY